MEQESLGPRSEMDEYEDWIQWLDTADEMLQIIEQPVYDRETEFSVGLTVILASLIYDVILPQRIV